MKSDCYCLLMFYFKKKVKGILFGGYNNNTNKNAPTPLYKLFPLPTIII